MARKRRKTTAKSGGSTLFGIMVGLILGLVAAVGVALFVTQVPMPFHDKASREPARTLLPDVRNAPDPNIGLYGKSALPDATPMMPPPSPIPGQADSSTARSGDNLGDLIATLVDGAKTPAAPAPDSSQVAVIPGVTEPSSGTSGAGAQGRYFLQAGAFRSGSDAESVKAQILLLGLPAHVEQAQVGGSTINRVRVGPFDGLDAMNRARAQLGTQKIESTVVKQ